MPSGFCDFCQLWHSATCCHPGRVLLAQRDERIAELEQKLHDEEVIWAKAQRKLYDQLQERIAELERTMDSNVRDALLREASWFRYGCCEPDCKLTDDEILESVQAMRRDSKLYRRIRDITTEEKSV